MFTQSALSAFAAQYLICVGDYGYVSSRANFLTAAAVDTLCSRFALHDADPAARADSSRAGGDHLQCIVHIPDAARSLDSHCGTDSLADQRHVFFGRAALGESGRSLDKLRARAHAELGNFYFFRIGQQAGFNDNLDDRAARSIHDGLDILQYQIPVCVLNRADIRDHVDLLRAVGNRVDRLHCLDKRSVRAKRKSDYRTYVHACAPELLRRIFYVRRIEAYGGKFVFDRLFAELVDLGKRRIRCQNGMVDVCIDRDRRRRAAAAAAPAVPSTCFVTDSIIAVISMILHSNLSVFHFICSIYHSADGYNIVAQRAFHNFILALCRYEHLFIRIFTDQDPAACPPYSQSRRR